MPNNGVPNNGLTFRNNLEVFKEIVNDGLPIVHVFPYKMACMSYLLFEIEEFFIDESQRVTELQLKVKNIGDGRFSMTMTDEDCALQWWEEIHTFDHTFVDGNVAAANSFDVLDVSLLKGLHPNTRVRIQSTAAPGSVTEPVTKFAIVQNVAGNTITVDRNLTLNDGDKVYRGANLRLRCGAIDNQYELNKRSNYKSFFQSIQASVEFETCELSADREIYSSNSGKSQMLVNAKTNAMFENLLQVDFMDAWLYGENVPQNSPQVSQTRGLITGIQDAQVAIGTPLIVDVSGAIGTTDDEEMITILIEYFIKAFDSGYYNSEPITAIINKEQLKQLMLMAPSFEEYFGIQMFRETPASHEGCRDFVTLRVHGIEIEHGVVEFVLMEPLNHYHDEPIMLLVPRSMFGMYQRKMSMVDSNLRVTEPEGNGAFPRFTFKDLSDKINLESGGDECFKFVTKLELAFVQAGLYNCAYWVIRNAKSYKTFDPLNVVQSDLAQLVY